MDWRTRSGCTMGRLNENRPPGRFRDGQRTNETMIALNRTERDLLITAAKVGVSAPPGDILRYEATIDLMVSSVRDATEQLHDELDHMGCTGTGCVQYDSAADPGSCLCSHCCLHRVSDKLMACTGEL